jgi:2-aminoadipate transaminase
VQQGTDSVLTSAHPLWLLQKFTFVDKLKLYQAALAAGVAINPGPEWSTDKAYAGSRLRLCFASPSQEQIREGVAVLAEVCRKEFGVPARIANVEKRAQG